MNNDKRYQVQTNMQRKRPGGTRSPSLVKPSTTVEFKRLQY